MPRPRRSLAILCIAAVALAAFLPGATAVDYAVLEPAWVLLPDLASLVVVPEPGAPDREQPLPLLPPVAPRPPPAHASA